MAASTQEVAIRHRGVGEGRGEGKIVGSQADCLQLLARPCHLTNGKGSNACSLVRAAARGRLRFGDSRRAFTLIELLLAMAISAILAALLLPSLATAQARGKQIACLNNLKQLALGSQMYANDNEGKLVGNTPKDADTNRWVAGTMKSPTDSTNQSCIRQGKLFPYAGQLATYRCPSDPARTQGTPHVRSYAMNGWMGSRYMESHSGQKGFRTFVTDSELAAAGPANLWGLMDEHEASIDDGWFLVTMDDSQPFASFPATRHQRGFNLNFADGHAQVFKLRDPNTQFPVRQGVSAKNSDWLRLKQVTTTK